MEKKVFPAKWHQAAMKQIIEESAYLKFDGEDHL